jgi:gluconate 5-dehydrogenase
VTDGPARHVRDLFDLHGRTAIVTGGGTHLGKAFAETLAELGARVFIVSRRASLCEQVAADFRSRGLDVTGRGCDATDVDQVRAVVEEIVGEYGRLDVMVANAGGHRTTRHPPDGPMDEFYAAFEMNLVTTYVCAQEAGRVMLPAGRGSIVTIGSIGSRLAMNPRTYTPNFQRSGAPYLATKAGVPNLTRALAAEWGGSGIRVNCICLGQIPPAGTDPEQVEIFRTMNALQRTGVAQDVKGAIALLASDAGAWITGQEVMVDGGWSIW